MRSATPIRERGSERARSIQQCWNLRRRGFRVLRRQLRWPVATDIYTVTGAPLLTAFVRAKRAVVVRNKAAEILPAIAGGQRPIRAARDQIQLEFDSKEQSERIIWRASERRFACSCVALALVR